MKPIPYGRHSVEEEDIAAVINVLRSDWLTQGPAVPQFEATVRQYCGAAYGVAVSSGTAALHLACRALALGPGDIMWTSAMTFAASANCALYCGASVDFVDVDPRTLNISVEALEAKLRDSRKTGRLPKVLTVVHFAGLPCDMQRIHALSREYGFKTIEDAAHALGATYSGVRVGACRHSDIAIFSFHPVKHITTGEGGMVLTNDRGLAETVELLHTHGITRDPSKMSTAPHGPWYYEQIELGFNYRMTDIQAALGTSQMARIDNILSRRRELAIRYHSAFADLPVISPGSAPDSESAWHLYVIQIDKSRSHRGRHEVFVALHQAGIRVNVHYLPVHLHPYYRARGFRENMFPNAELVYRRAITLPLYPALEDQTQDRVIAQLCSALV